MYKSVVEYIFVKLRNLKRECWITFFLQTLNLWYHFVESGCRILEGRQGIALEEDEQNTHYFSESYFDSHFWFGKKTLGSSIPFVDLKTT